MTLPGPPDDFDPIDGEPSHQTRDVEIIDLDYDSPATELQDYFDHRGEQPTPAAIGYEPIWPPRKPR